MHTFVDGEHGFPEFIRLSELHNLESGFIVDDTLTIDVDVEVTSSNIPKISTGCVGLKRKVGGGCTNSVLLALFHIPRVRGEVLEIGREEWERNERERKRKEEEEKKKKEEEDRRKKEKEEEGKGKEPEKEVAGTEETQKEEGAKKEEKGKSPEVIPTEIEVMEDTKKEEIVDRKKEVQNALQKVFYRLLTSGKSVGTGELFSSLGWSNEYLFPPSPPSPPTFTSGILDDIFESVDGKKKYFGGISSTVSSLAAVEVSIMDEKKGKLTKWTRKELKGTKYGMSVF